MAESTPVAPPEHSITPTILLAMTAVTGIVDAVSYLALGHVFTANMTGNVVLLGFAIARTGGLSTARSLTALVCFLAGAVAGGRVALPHARRALIVETGLLFLASAAALVRGAELSVFSVIAITAVAMGYRNAVVRKIAMPDLTTTVLTLTITGLGADSGLAGGENPRWQRRVAAILALVFGAFAGALMIQKSVALALAVSGTITAASAIVAYRIHYKENQQQ